MKHLLNNMSEEEKNTIREQHTGGMKVITENFYKLLNSKLGDVKPLTEQSASGAAQQGQSVQSTPKKAVAAISTYGFSLLIPKALEYLNGSGTSDVKVQKFCQLCNVNTSDEHKFKGKACIKCCSKKNNAMLIEKCNYYKEYYENNKKPTGNPRGRPVGSIKVKFDD